MPAGNNNFVDTDAKIKDFLNAVLSSEGIVVDIRRTFINYNGVNRSRVFARRANEMASKGGNEKFVVIALMCYPALQWILQAQDIDRLVEELREQNPDESVSRRRKRLQHQSSKSRQSLPLLSSRPQTSLPAYRSLILC